jgi:cytochrome c oxidase subunit 3
MQDLNKIKYFPKGPKHPFHIVDPSPWPLHLSIGLFFVASGLVMYMHEYQFGWAFCLFGLILAISWIKEWFEDVIYEATFQGKHTTKVQTGLKYGMGLFILSEIMFFLSFFWAFFHSSLSPSIEFGCIWPPKEISVINPYAIPLWNTLLLVTSGITITLSHANLRIGNLERSSSDLIDTISLGVIFTILQVAEYCTSEFTISDSVYGSVFYMITGFHGFHVLVGTIFLIVCFFRMKRNHFTSEHHVGYEFAIWYWHFVDVIWILVYIFIYIWGNHQI